LSRPPRIDRPADAGYNARFPGISAGKDGLPVRRQAAVGKERGRILPAHFFCPIARPAPAASCREVRALAVLAACPEDQGRIDLQQRKPGPSERNRAGSQPAGRSAAGARNAAPNLAGRSAGKSPGKKARNGAPSAGKKVAPQTAPHAARARPVRPVGSGNAQQAIEHAVAALGYELVDVEHAARGLLRVSIDRVAGCSYPSGPGDAVTIEDCEAVTRQLQYALEVEALDYARLEVSSPGLDRPLRRPADYERFCGLQVALALREPFQGRRHFTGTLGRAQPPAGEGGDPPGIAAESGWTLQFSDGRGEQVLAFALHEVRDARLVPVLDFKGRRNKPQTAGGDAATAAADGVDGGLGE
jgi:ribosome maturation factor RimP